MNVQDESHTTLDVSPEIIASRARRLLNARPLELKAPPFREQVPDYLEELTTGSDQAMYEDMERAGPPPKAELQGAVDQFNLEREQFGVARTRLLKALEATAEGQYDAALVDEARELARLTLSTEGQALRSLAEVGLADSDIARLVAEKKHVEVRELFAQARQHFGVHGLQPAFEAYQRALGGVSEVAQPGWGVKHKRWLAAHLNSCARSLCAYLEHDGHRGLLNVAGHGATFQLRHDVGGRERQTGLGQGLPVLSLVAKTPRELGVKR